MAKQNDKQKQIDMAFEGIQKVDIALKASQDRLDALQKPFQEKIERLSKQMADASEPILKDMETLRAQREASSNYLLSSVPPNETIGRVFHKLQTRKSVSYLEYSLYLKQNFIPKTKQAEADQAVEQFTKTTTTHKLEFLEG